MLATTSKIRVIKAPIPLTRDPFINTPLIRLPATTPGGPERFWISTWNSNSGTTAVLIDELGQHQIHRFQPPHYGFYSAVAAGPDTLWLCGDLSRVVRYTPSTRKIEAFETGAPGALVFNGLVLDKPTGKLMVSAFPDKPHAFVFDTKKLKPVWQGPIDGAGVAQRCTYPVGDGTWASIKHIAGEYFLYWNPKDDSLVEQCFNPKLDAEDLSSTTYFLLEGKIPGAKGNCVYLPKKGWFDLAARKLVKRGPRPERESTWIGQWKNFAVGVANPERSNATVSLWNLDTGKVRDVCKLSDTPIQNVNFTQSGAIVSVSLYGKFSRCDLITGELQASRTLDVDAIGAIDCMTRIGKDRVLGTTFITQRFWEVNLRTQKGEDLGRVAPGMGEIMRLCKVGEKVYMAAYTGGELVEFDPAKPARFPENPRVVTTPKDAMRPVAITAAGPVVYYSSNAPYGNLGSVLTSYNTETGVANYSHDPIPKLAIRTLGFDASAKLLLAGTAWEGDCGASVVESKHVSMVTIDPQTLRVTQEARLPEGIPAVYGVCPMGRGKWACVTAASAGKPGAMFEVSIRKLAIPPESTWRALPVAGPMHPTRTPGVVVVRTREGLQLWDLIKGVKLRDLAGKESAGRHFHIEGDDILFNDATTVYLLDGALRGV